MTDAKVKMPQWRRLLRMTLIALVVAVGIIGLILKPKVGQVQQPVPKTHPGATVQLVDEPGSWKRWLNDPFGLEQVKHLRLRVGTTIDADIELILQQEELRGLVLHGTGITPEHIEMLRQHPSLHVVLLIGTGLSREQVGQDGPAIAFNFVADCPISRMNELQIRYKVKRVDVGIPDSQFPEIAEELVDGFKVASASIIDMQHVVIDRETIETISEQNVVDWLLVGYGFDDSMADLLPKFGSVRRLDLSQSMITDEGIKAVLEMPNLRVLTLGPNMTDEAMVVLSKSKTIDGLYCGKSQVGDAGVIAMKDSTTLKALGLGCRLVTRKSMDALTEYPQLRELQVSGCLNLKDEDSETLFQMKHLERVSMDVSSEQRKKIQRGLPNLEFMGGRLWGF